MIFDYSELKGDADDTISGIDSEHELVKAKTFLQKTSNLTGDNL